MHLPDADARGCKARESSGEDSDCDKKVTLLQEIQKRHVASEREIHRMRSASLLEAATVDLRLHRIGSQ